MTDRQILNRNLAQMLKGGVIMDVTNAQEAEIAEAAGAVAVMALERVPSDIRGMGSFNASNSPLYVIDGIPMRSGSINTMSSDAGLDIMSTINSSDIENITIIKDAAAASLYGSRAANGVVLITTKKGKRNASAVRNADYLASITKYNTKIWR